jgi:hypothetical protein
MNPMKRPTIPGWHSEDVSADLLGESLQKRRINRRLGIGPRAVKHGRRYLYRDGAEEEYLTELQAKTGAAGQSRPPRLVSIDDAARLRA